jgi:hypothetical protein
MGLDCSRGVCLVHKPKRRVALVGSDSAHGPSPKDTGRVRPETHGAGSRAVRPGVRRGIFGDGDRPNHERLLTARGGALQVSDV